MKDKSKKKKSHTIALLLVIIISGPFTLLVVDMVLRGILGDDFVIEIETPDKNIGVTYNKTDSKKQIFYFYPGSDKIDGYMKNTFWVRINSMGLRGSEPKNDNADIFRIMCLGDSTTFGFGENEEYIFTTLLQNKLNKILPTEVYNFGHPGTTSWRGYLQYREMAETLNPDVVIISFAANDAVDVAYRSGMIFFPKMPDDECYGPNVEISMSSEIGFKLTPLIFPVLSRSAILCWLKRELMLSNETGNIKPSGVKRVSVEKYMENTKKIIELAAKSGSSSLILSACSIHVPEYVEAAKRVSKDTNVPLIVANDLYKGSWESYKSDKKYFRETKEVEKRFGKLLREIPRFIFTNDRCHPNPLGHRLIADTLAVEIEKIIEEEDFPKMERKVK